MSSPYAHPRRRMREALRRFQENDEEQAHYAQALTDPSTSSSMGPPRARPRARPSERFLELNRQRLHRIGQIGSTTHPSDTNDTIAERNNSVLELQRDGERLDQSTDDLRDLLHRPLEIESLTIPDRDLSTHELEARSKRRRTEAPMALKEYPRIEYGYHGQVKPGKLKVEIVAADGSITGNESPWNDPYFSRVGQGMAENVLRDDPSTYNAKSPRCNIIFRHQGETSFTLDKLVIKAPKRVMGDWSVSFKWDGRLTSWLLCKLLDTDALQHPRGLGVRF